MFATEVQFGHAGSLANSQLETAATKNKSMKEAGIYVPDTFEDLPELLSQVYQSLVKNGTIKPQPEPVPPKVRSRTTFILILLLLTFPFSSDSNRLQLGSRAWVRILRLRSLYINS